MKRFRRYVIAFAAGLGGLAAVIGVALSQAPSPTDLMAEANAQYERGEYGDAAQQYEALIASGYEDAALYYNLGNAYFKKGELGLAVLNYLRAEELSPRRRRYSGQPRTRTQQEGQGRVGRGVPLRKRVQRRPSVGHRWRDGRPVAAAVGRKRYRHRRARRVAGDTREGRQ